MSGRLVLGVGIALAVAGCGDDGGGSDGSGGSGAAGGGQDSGTAGTSAVVADEPNDECPAEVGPLFGEFAPKGECCYRTANSVRNAGLSAGEEGTLEYRLNYTEIKNHPLTAGHPGLLSTVQRDTERETRSTLWRFKAPVDGMGGQASGISMNTVGSGVYNCDGTYSFYSEDAAPDRDISDEPDRWASTPVPAMVDVDRDCDDPDRIQVDWEKTVNRELAFVPFLDTETFELSWELVTQGFDIVRAPCGAENENCVGRRSDSTSWRTGGEFIFYTPMKPNDVDMIPTTGNTYCNLIAFGIQVEEPIATCFETPRCEPGTADCKWLKLPDSLCPETEAEMAMWGCHVGYEDNPDGESTRCTSDQPTGPLNPNEGATSEGQCCDPLGESSSLPACNAYLVRNAYVAAAAEITDEPTDSIQAKCDP